MDEYLPILVTYNLTDQEIDAINNGQIPLTYTNSPVFERLEGFDLAQLGSNFRCREFTTTYTFSIPCTCHTDADHEAAPCGHPQGEVSVTVTELGACTGDGDTSGSFGDGGTSDSEGGGGSTIDWGGAEYSPYNPDNNDDDILAEGPITQINPPLRSAVRTYMSDLLDFHDTNFLNYYPHVETAFNTYLNNNLNTEGFQFIDWSIDYLQYMFLSGQPLITGENSHHPENLVYFNDIVYNNQSSEEIIADLQFHQLAQDLIAEGGEVDYEDNLIVHNSFKNNQKAKFVYDKMKNINGSVFSDLLSKFDNSTNALLVFKTANIPSGSNGVGGKGITLPRLNQGSTTTRYDIVLDLDFVQNATLIEIALALSHEMIHAELMARCVKLGIITEMTFDANTYNVGVSFNNNPIVTTNISDILFSRVADQYTNFSNTNTSNSNWQHELFNTFNNRDKIAQNVESVHPWLDDILDPISGYVSNAFIPMSMDEYFKSISWFGLESTTEYNNLTDVEIAKKNQAYSITNQYYNKNPN